MNKFITKCNKQGRQILANTLHIKNENLIKAILLTFWLALLVVSVGIWPFIIGIYLILTIQQKIANNKLKYSLVSAILLITFLVGIPWARANYSSEYRAETAARQVEENAKKVESTKLEEAKKAEAIKVVEDQKAAEEAKNLADAKIKQEAEEAAKPKVEVKDDSKTESIAFETIYENDATLDKGKTSVKQTGKNGSKLFRYKVTYTDGVETARETVSETTTLAPTNKIILNGTKITPVVTEVPDNSKTYINVDGNEIKSPGSDPSGATAKCRDGSYSYSQHRSGTCSGHGGVANWL
jgi:hypothetical protein